MGSQSSGGLEDQQSEEKYLEFSSKALHGLCRHDYTYQPSQVHTFPPPQKDVSLVREEIFLYKQDEKGNRRIGDSQVWFLQLPEPGILKSQSIREHVSVLENSFQGHERERAVLTPTPPL